jgi:hypothetical protein
MSSADLHLVRVESVVRIAAAAGSEPFDLVRRLEDYAADSTPGPSSTLWLKSILDSFATQTLRPTFAGFLEDVRDLFATGAASGAVIAGLRDRFGLTHYDPREKGEIPLAVFRYPIAAVPRLGGRDHVPLVSPTVLESGSSAAFCPAPSATRFGSAVALVVASWPAREVVHLPFRYDPEHLTLAGILDAPVPGNLAASRARHLRSLRAAGASGYALSTDSDILSLAP